MLATDNPVEARHVLLLIALGVVSSVAGYTLSHVLFSEALIRAFALGGSGEWERSIIGDILFQLCCGIPLPLFAGTSIALTPVVIGRFFRIALRIWIAIVGALGFIAGSVGYFPWQFLLLLGAAF